MAGWGLHEGLSAGQTNRQSSEGSCPLFPGFHWSEAGPDSFFAFVHGCEEVLTSEVLSGCMCAYVEVPIARQRTGRHRILGVSERDAALSCGFRGV